jgi:hypothetical protein
MFFYIKSNMTTDNLEAITEKIEKFDLTNFVNKTIKKQENIILNDRRPLDTMPLCEAVKQIIKLQPPIPEEKIYMFKIIKDRHNIPLLFMFYKSGASIYQYLSSAKLCITRYVNPNRKGEFIAAKNNRKKIHDEDFFNEIAKEDQVVIKIEYNVSKFLDELDELKILLQQIADFNENNKVRDFYHQTFTIDNKVITTTNISLGLNRTMYDWDPINDNLKLKIHNHFGTELVENFNIPKINYTEKDSYFEKIKLKFNIIPVINLVKLSITNDYFTKEDLWEPTFYANRIYKE